MKLKSIIILIISTFALSSCLEGSYSSTPELYLGRPVIIGGDSLYLSYTDEGLRLDSISVGDTVQFYTAMSGFSNNLTAFYLKLSNDSTAKVILPRKSSMDSIFVAGSNYDEGTFLFAESVNELLFPFKYVALKKSENTQIKLTVVSDAKFENSSYGGSNTSSLIIVTPIK
jgi:hypothetical protein